MVTDIETEVSSIIGRAVCDDVDVENHDLCVNTQTPSSFHSDTVISK